MSNDQNIDIEAWKRDGEAIWQSVEANKLVIIPWNNPWYRFAIIGIVLLISCLFAKFAWGSNSVSAVLALISAPCVFIAIKFYYSGAKIGGLYTFYSETGFGIGCDADRISIPYSLIELPEYISPSTVNDNYIILPVKPELDKILIERKDGNDHKWNGAPYKRGIACLRTKENDIRVEANPNEFIVNMFSTLHPLCLYLKDRNAQQNGVTDA